MPDFATRLSTIISKTDIFSNQYLYTPAPPSYSYIFSQSQSSTQDSNLHPIRKNIKETVKIDKQILSLCIMFLEVFIRTREDLRPDPKTDPIEMIALKIRDDLGKSKEIIYMLGTSHFNYKGKHEVTVEIVSSEKHLLRAIVEEMQVSDPDVVISFEAEKMGIGYLIKRSNFIWKDFVHLACRQPQFIVQQTYRYKKLSSLLPGRIILSCWRLIKSETHFYSYTLQNLVYCCLNLRFPSYSFKQQTFIFDHRRIELVEYIWDCLEYSKKLVEHFGILERNVTLAQIYGIDYESVFTRGSQFRVEAMLKKQVKGTHYLLLSAMKRQVSSQTKIQCVPLVLEPPKKFWTDPVLVLDFQSLYPSIMIAYNLCYSTCLGKVAAQRYKKFGVTHMKGEVFDGQDMIITPNNVAFVKKTTRLGFIPMMMHELLQTRIMVKNSMKLVDKGSSRYHELFVQQLGIKMLCNTTYGYAGAGDTGRMPCNDIADSIVAIARRTLEDAIQFVESHPEWQASVIYGDTDSMMVHLPGRSLEQAFLLGKEIASAVSSRNPRPVELLFEKVYFPMLTLAKKHYAGMKYERPGSTPVFDAKGIETVRTDYCQLSSKILEGALLRLFESRDLSQVFRYLNNKWTKVLNNRYQLKDFILYEKVILGQYKNPPAGIKVSLKNMEIDKMRKPLFGERVAFVIRTGQPGDPVTELAVNPEDFLASQTWTLNLDYYMDKQINKVLDRTLAPVGVDVKVWYKFLPKRKTPLSIESLQPKKAMIRNESKRIDRFFASGLCVVCRKFVNKTLCHGCKSDPQKTVLAIMASMNKRERKLLSLLEVCRGCTGSLDQILCTSLDCPIYHSRLKLEHESFSISKRLIDLSW
jgi:DNA polymerase zeta